MWAKALSDAFRLAARQVSGRRPQTWMQEIAAYHARRPEVASRVCLYLINATLRCRRAYRTRIELRWRALQSRRAFRSATLSPVHVGARCRRVSLLCPTRARARQACEFVRSVRRTAADTTRVEVLFYVDSDDPQLGLYETLLAREAGRTPRLAACKVVVGPPMSISKSWNVLAAQSTGDVVGMANDDQIYVDYAWDHALDRAATLFADDIFCMYFDGGQYVGRTADFPLVSRRWYETLNYFTPGIFAFWFNEHWILDIAQRIGRLHAIPGILVEHLHFTAFLAPFDATYQQHRLTWETGSADLNLYNASAKLRERGAQALRAVMASKEARA